MTSCLRILLLVGVAAFVSAGCSNGSPAAPAVVVNPPPPPAVTGISTPKAVSVVTAN